MPGLSALLDLGKRAHHRSAPADHVDRRADT